MAGKEASGTDLTAYTLDVILNDEPPITMRYVYKNIYVKTMLVTVKF